MVQDTHTGEAGFADIEARRRANIKRLFNPKSVVVIGASADSAKAGSQALISLRSFAGDVIAVHPRETEIQGRRCYNDIDAMPEGVDLAILAIPARSCPDAVAKLAARNVGGVFIISGGFGETGEEGAALQDALAEICARTGIRLLGPNTSGFVAPHVPLIASFVPGVDGLEKGRVAVIAQSGGVNLSLAFILQDLGEGPSLAVGLGNAIDVDSADVLQMLAEDPHTSAIALHLEGVSAGRRLYDQLAQVTPIKPVVALVAGKADIGDFAVSHTGNLLGSRQRTVSALQQAGAVVVDTTDELAQAAVALSSYRLAPSMVTRAALVTGQAGPGLLIADALKSAGVDMPALGEATRTRLETLLPPMTYVQNPVDTGRPGPTFAEVVEAAAQDEQIDAVLVYGLSEPAVLDPAKDLALASKVGKPVLFGTLGPKADTQEALAALKADGILGVLGPDRLSFALQVLAEDARARVLMAHRAAPVAKSSEPLAGLFDEDRAKALLAAHGIRSPQRVLCTTRDEAIAAFAGMSKPVVAKIAASDIAHKTEVGGVILNISDEDALNAALDRIAAIPTNDPGKVLLEEMAGEGVELIVGGVRDASWGPIVMVGLGGIFTEVLADTALRLAPVASEQAGDMLASLRGGAILDGFRGMPAVDHKAIAEVIVALGNLMVAHPEIAEIEINPLRVSAKGALALDALISLGDVTAHER